MAHLYICTWSKFVVFAIIFVFVTVQYKVVDWTSPRSKICEYTHVPEEAMATEVIVSSTKYEAPPPADSPMKQVLLLSYGRSGTTFTSAIISHHRDVFHISEPLHELLQNHNTLSQHILEVNRMDALNVLRSFLSCDGVANSNVVYKSVMYQASNDTMDFFRCVRNRTLHSLDYLNCFLKMWQTCRAHNVMFVKTIRTPVRWVESILPVFPNLKVLYLIRDPRATVQSQSRRFRHFSVVDTPKAVSSEFCSVVRQDVKDFKHLTALFPGRMKAIRYEDGALWPGQYSKDIYSFLGLAYDKSIQEFVQNITKSKSSKKVTSFDYGFEKADSQKSMNGWRQQISYEAVGIMDEMCKDLYPILGYKPVKSKDELLSDLPLVTETKPDSIF